MTYEHVDGVERETAKLRDFPVQVEKNVIRGAVRAAASFMRKVALPLVPLGRGHKGLHLVDSLRVSSRVKKGTATAGVKVGDRRKGIFWASMVLGGTKPHVIRSTKRGLWFGIFRRSVQHPGAEANPFMAKADGQGRDGALKAAFNYADERTRKLVAEQNNEAK